LSFIYFFHSWGKLLNRMQHYRQNMRNYLEIKLDWLVN